MWPECIHCEFNMARHGKYTCHECSDLEPPEFSVWMTGDDEQEDDGAEA